MNSSVLHLCFWEETPNLGFYKAFIDQSDVIIVFGCDSNHQRQMIKDEVTDRCAELIFCDHNDYSELIERLPEFKKTWTWK